MYLNCLVKLPDASGKLIREKRNNSTYIKYEYDRIYDSQKQYTYPKRVTIGKLSCDDPTMMQPTPAFLQYFPDAELPESESRTDRSCALKIGTYAVISKIIDECGLRKTLSLFLNEKDLGLFLDLASYSIISENNAAQYYPNYAFCHPLFTPNMKIYSDSKVTDFLQSLTEEQSVGFLNEWNAARSHREKIYISYDSTNKNCQAGDIEMVEFGHAKDEKGLPVFNYSLAYDTDNREPLFYEKYPGSIVDVSQLRIMLEKAKGYGYKHIGFILDRGYFIRQNLNYMDECGYSFVIMAKGMSNLVNAIIEENLGSFEKKRACDMEKYGVYGKTVKRKIRESDSHERYFHIYHSVTKEAEERTKLESDLKDMKKYLMKHVNEDIDFGSAYEKYFYIHRDSESGVFIYPEEKTSVTEKELNLCGYFCIITSEKMTAKEALYMYKSRDVNEKLFRGDKTYLGNRSLRVHSSESAAAKIFIEFAALIIRNRIYTCLSEEMSRIGKKENYMTVPAAIEQLEMIEMSRQSDNIYRLDHAVTATQKKILHAFGMDENTIKHTANEISTLLRNNQNLRKD